MSTPKSKFAGLVGQINQPDPQAAAAAPERVEKALPSAPAPPVAPAGPPLPTAMNFKLSTEQAKALRLVQFETGKTKQQVVSEALDEWIKRYTSP